MWAGWLLIWLVAARSVKPNLWREGVAASLLHRVPLFAAAVLLATARFWPAFLDQRFLPASPAVEALGLLLVLAGLGSAIWSPTCCERAEARKSPLVVVPSRRS